MSAISKSLIVGTYALALLALAGCNDGGASKKPQGIGSSTNPQAGAGGNNPQGGASGASPTGGAGGMSSGGGGGGADGVAGIAGGSSGEGGSVGPILCTTEEDKRTGEACENVAEGVFALKTVIDVWWVDDASPPLVDPGRGTLTIYLMGELSEVCSDGSNAKGVIRGCGTELPAFKSDANCDAFQIQFPEELWDRPDMPTFDTTASTTGFNPNDTLSINIATGLVGIDLAEVNGTWPATADDVTCPAGAVDLCFPDDDGDGHPGVTVKMARVGENLTADGCGGFNLPFVFRGAPLDALGGLVDEGIKAETLFIGVRTRIGGAGLINADCASGVGDSQAEFIDSRVIGCKKKEPGDGMPEEDCTLTDAQFVDASAPIYRIIAKGEAPPTDIMKPSTQGGGPLDQTPSVGPRSALVRLGDLGRDFTCADVRAAPFGAL